MKELHEGTVALTEWLAAPAIETSKERAALIYGVVLGVLVDLGERGPLVEFDQNPDKFPIVARATAPLTSRDIGREVALLFEAGDPARPIVIGPLHRAAPAQPAPKPVDADSERLVFTAKKEIVFRCGKASLTLTRAGKILLRGEYLLTEATGVNRIRGGTVEIN